MPQNAAGMRTDPQKSPPNSSGDNPAATAAAPPPVLPPGVRSRSHGLFERPKTGLSDCQSDAYMGTLVLPSSTIPAARRSAAAGASVSDTSSPRSINPPVVGSPRT